MSILDTLSDLSAYRERFLDLELWRPYVVELLRRNGLPENLPLRTGIPGTYPTFVGGDRVVVKLFGRLFDGWHSFLVEREANQIVATAGIQAPNVLAHGVLFPNGPGWSWPYLIFSYLPGQSVGELWPRLSAGNRLQMARQLGKLVRHLHRQPVRPGSVFGPGWTGYREFLAERRQACVADQRAWNALPDHLLDEIDTFLPAVDDLFDATAQPHLIHADLTRDHILGHLDGQRWVLSGMIDFGDAMIGSLPYELVALHMDLFNGEPRCLNAFLDGYGIGREARVRLPKHALAAALIHRFDVFSGVFERQPELRNVNHLPGLARRLFSIS